MSVQSGLRYVFLVLFSGLVSLTLFAHEPVESGPMDLRTSFSLGYLVGGTFSPNQYSYRSGLSARLGVEAALSPRLSMGPAVGYNQHNDEYFIPLGISAYFNSKPQGIGFFAEAGYSFARTRLEDVNIAYDLDGSGYITLGSRWSYALGESLYLEPAVLFTIHRTETQFNQDITNPFSIREDRLSMLFHLGIAF